MSLEKLMQAVQETYAFYQQLQVSPAFLLGLVALFALAALLAFREAVAWFFKVEDIKRDIARLQQTANQLEAEIRVAQNLIQKSSSIPAVAIPDDEVVGPTHLKQKEETDRKTTGSFPISH